MSLNFKKWSRSNSVMLWLSGAVCSGKLKSIKALLDGQPIKISAGVDLDNNVNIHYANTWIIPLSNANRFDVRFRDSCNKVKTVSFSIAGAPMLDF